MPRLLTVSCLVYLLVVSVGAQSSLRPAPEKAQSQTSAKDALKRFNPLIGGWRGVGQPRRGSAAGAWSEKANWTWQFGKSRKPDKGNPQTSSAESVTIRFQAPSSKLIVDGQFRYAPTTGLFMLEATMADKSKRLYTGKPTVGGALVLESRADKSGHVHRLTIRTLNEKRTLVLHERRREKSTFYTRVAGIGYTRQGTRLASNNIGPVCIVTEGKGTSKVSYKGKTYWVCCSGCRDAFLDDPEGVLADARERKAERKKKAKKKS